MPYKRRSTTFCLRIKLKLSSLMIVKQLRIVRIKAVEILFNRKVTLQFQMIKILNKRLKQKPLKSLRRRKVRAKKNQCQKKWMRNHKMKKKKRIPKAMNWKLEYWQTTLGIDLTSLISHPAEWNLCHRVSQCMVFLIKECNLHRHIWE